MVPQTSLPWFFSRNGILKFQAAVLGLNSHLEKKKPKNSARPVVTKDF